MSEFNLGDRVVVVSDVRPANVGRTGTITQIERFTGSWPYKVEFDDGDTNPFSSWVFDAIELRAEDSAPTTTEESDK